MIRLIRVELTRLRWRRAVLLLVGAAIVVPAIILGARIYDTRPVSAADRAEAQVLVDQEKQYQQESIADCLDNPDAFGIAPEDAERFCTEYNSYPIDIDSYLYREQLSVAEEPEATGLAVVAVIAMLMLLTGTTFVGHDWASGSMSNQLLFETRRLRVWSAKAIAISLLALVVGAIGLAIFWGGIIGVAQARDLDVNDTTVTAALQQAGRGLALAVGGAFGGYALTTLFRSTVATVGVLFGVSVAGGLLFGALLPQSALRFEPTTNALAVVNGQQTYFVDPPSDCVFDDLDEGAGYFGDEQPSVDYDDPCSGERRVTQTGGAIYYVVLLGALGLASAGSYRRRDVP